MHTRFSPLFKVTSASISRLAATLLVMTLFVGQSFGQGRAPFPESGPAFIEELSKVLKDTKRDDYKAISDALVEQSAKGALTEEMLSIAVANYNRMIAKRMTIIPNYGAYAQAMVVSAAAAMDAQNYTDWSASAQYLIENRTQDVDNYLTGVTNLVSKSSLFESGQTRWRTSAKTYAFRQQGKSTVFVFNEEAEIVGLQGKDSTVISGTKGSFDPLSQVFTGIGGKVDWRRIGIASDSVFVELTNYRLSVKGVSLKADTVKYTDMRYLKKPLVGRFEDRFNSTNELESASFPEFVSYSEVTRIKEFLPGVNYVGKFAVEGYKVLALSSESVRAQLQFVQGSLVVARTIGERYTFRRGDMLAPNTATSIYLKNDSIYHPGLNTKYNFTTRQLTLLRDESNLAKVPFYDSYHALDIIGDVLTYSLDGDSLTIRAIVSAQESVIGLESKDYYSEARFDKIQGPMSANPLVMLKLLADKVGKRTFTHDEYAAHIKVPVNAVKSNLMDLASQGYLFYVPSVGVITLKDKLYNYVDAAARRKDYDVIRVFSKVTNNNNITLDRSTLRMTVRGVNIVLLSDSHSVYIKPRNQEMTFLKNRDIEFAGHMHAGVLDFYGDGFKFEYDAFQVKMTKVDSMKIKAFIEDKDRSGRFKQIDINSVMENMTGFLYVDKPDNKSGRKPFKQYPIFKSTSESDVFYDRSAIFDGVYKRDKFYFHVLPFVVDSLDDKRASKNLEFPGTLKSAGIFTDIKQVLRLQADTSLGFIHETEATGLRAYGGKGQFFNTVKLSNSGLRGEGILKYLASTTVTKELIFFPDSARGTVQEFNVPKGLFRGVGFPEVAGKDAFEFWKPYEDTMFVRSRTTPINVLGEQASLAGEFIYTPAGASAKGKINYGKDQLAADLFRFKQNSIESQAASLALASQDPTKLAFKSEDFRTTVDFDKKKGTFISNTDETAVVMPYNKYKAYLSAFYWDLNTQNVALGSERPTSAMTTRFVSMQEGQDSLEFMAAYGIFNQKDFSISAFGVERVGIADAFILPDSGQVTIMKDAQFRTLVNAKILVDTASQKNVIYNAKVDIFSALKYTGSGYFDYVNLTKKKQQVYFASIFVDSGRTRSSGNITPDREFLINPGFRFAGQVQLIGDQEELRFDGVVHLTDVMPEVVMQDLAFNEFVNPEVPYIGAKTLKSKSGENLHVGFVFKGQEGKMVPSLLQPLAAGDIPLFTALGVISFDPETKIYRIGSEAKINEDSLTGSVLTIDPKAKLLIGDGRITLGDVGKVQVSMAGKVEYSIANRVISFDVAQLADMNIPSDALKAMSAKIVDVGFELQDPRMDRPEMEGAIMELLGPDKGEAALGDLSTFASLQENNAPKVTFVMGDMNMEYAPASRSWHSTGKPGLLNINQTPIAKAMPGFFEVWFMPSGGTALTWYFEPTSDDWFILQLIDNKLSAYGTDPEFNKIISKKGKKEKTKDKNKIGVGDPSLREDLIRRVAGLQ